ncbi:MAG: HAMP domain-containing protein [Planctomycetota bacterium]|nr:HAMP domain-containing protein [Planctomycetota bacterium]
MFSIRSKLILFMSLLIIIIGTLSCLFFLIHSKKQQEKTLKKLGTSLVMLLAQDDEVKQALNYAQPAFLDTPISRIQALDRDEEIGYLRISNTQSVIVEEKTPWIDIDMKEIPTIKDFSITGVPRLDRLRTRGGAHVAESSRNSDVSLSNRKITCAGKVFYDFSIPIFGKQTFSEEEFAAQILGESEGSKEKAQQILGFVQIGLSPHKLNERVNEIIWRRILPMGLIIISGGICVTFFLSKYFVSPLRHMASITLDIAKGNLDRAIEIRSQDEVGQLSTNFNQMTKALRTSYEEKEKIMAQLRENVTELSRANKELVEIQERLVRSEKLAAIGKLASGVGHELRNPLGAIRNALFLIKKRLPSNGALNDNQKLNQLIELIEKETERSIKTINDLLGFSRIAKPTVSPTNIRSIIESSFSRLKIPDTIKKTVLWGDSLPLILVDASQIEQVFINLIQNSCDAMPMGGLLTIHAQREGSFVTTTCKDTGCGIPDDIKNKIFDPLFTTKPKGLGLGLAISSNIIQRHSGYIDLKSKEGEGTTFVVKLPIVKT